jgi:hypothetical protein
MKTRRKTRSSVIALMVVLIFAGDDETEVVEGVDAAHAGFLLNDATFFSVRLGEEKGVRQPKFRSYASEWEEGRDRKARVERKLTVKESSSLPGVPA